MRKIEKIKERIELRRATCVEIKSSYIRELYVYTNGFWRDVDTGALWTTDELCLHIERCYDLDTEVLLGKAKHRAAINAAKNLLTDWFSYNSWEDFPKLYRTLSAKEKLAVYLVLSYSTIFTDGCVPVAFAATTELSALWKESVSMQKRKTSLYVQVEDGDLTLTVDLFKGKVVRSIECDLSDLEVDLDFEDDL